MRGQPAVRREESPAEELAGLRVELVEVSAFDHDAHDAGAFGHDADDTQTMTTGLAERCKESVPHEQGEDVRVQERPGDWDQPMPGQVRPRQLVQERERDAEVR